MENECIEDSLILDYQIITDSGFDENIYTNGSDKTIIQTKLQSQCDKIEMEIEIPVDNHVTLNDFKTKKYTIYAANTISDLLNGKYNYTVPISDIISLSSGKLKYRTDSSAVFSVGKGSEDCVDCEPCVDCDYKPNTLCFIGSVINGGGSFGSWMFFGYFVFFLSVAIARKFNPV
ncbi:hypothetical protein MHK_008282 [Candidatus Magnetomorum sp. HK-1]|nr:hypothetical protein MHK_008282 [Candidatus Magnetomorum sp. HK-1]